MNFVIRQFNLTPQAKADLRDIWRYSTSTWGEQQADLYIAHLYARFEWLAQCPKMGKHREDICDGYYCFPQGSHLVFT
ncbi:type II toxin-antitoxin system RelE/ParE family toxin [Porticoccus sp. GXU_MW_L64]